MVGSTTFKAWVAQLVLDVAFSTMISLAFFRLLEVPAESVRSVLLIVVAFNVGKTVLWSATFWFTVRPISLWDQTDPGSAHYARRTLEAGQALYSAGPRLGLTSSIFWFLVYSGSTATILWIAPDVMPLPSMAIWAAVLFSVGTGAGALVATIPLTELLLQPLTERISLALQDHASFSRSWFNFSVRLTVIALGLAVAPTGFLASLGLMVDGRARHQQVASEAKIAVLQLRDSYREYEEVGDEQLAALVGKHTTPSAAPFVVTGGAITHGRVAKALLATSPELSAWMQEAHNDTRGPAVMQDVRTGRAVSCIQIDSSGATLGSVTSLPRAPYRSFLVAVLFFALAIICWAPLSAALLAGTVARAISQIAGVVDRIRVRGDASDAPRVPVLFRDELGTLASGTNEMVERLAETQREAANYSDTLEVKNRALEKAAIAKSQFLANMSHELRTPLNSIIGFSRILQRKTEGKLDEVQADNIRLINESGHHLLGLVNDLLDFEKIGAGAVRIVNREVELSDLMIHIADTFRPLAEESGLTLEVEPLGLRLKTDPDRLRQVLVNLVSNALKYEKAAQSD